MITHTKTEEIRAALAGNPAYVKYAPEFEPPFTDPSGLFCCIAEVVKVELYLEVGTFMGHSAVAAARAFPDAAILAVDTFTGSAEHYIEAIQGSRPEKQLMALHEDRRPALWEKAHDLWAALRFDHRITAIPLPSTEAARLVKWLGLRPNVIYIDGAHDYDSVLADCRAWWPVLADGGIMVGDDYYDPRFQVAAALQAFAPGGHEGHAGGFWSILKGGAR